MDVSTVRGRKGENMDKVKLSLEAIRTMMSLSRAEMAEKIGINQDRYNRLASGESRMLATEFIRLQEISGLPYEVIKPTP